MANVLNKDKQIAVIAALAEGSRYHVEPVYVETVPIKEVFQGQTVWEGDVEVFDLPDSPDADRVYAWAHETDNADEPRRHCNGLTYSACYIATEGGTSINHSRLP